jgi:hypothetical protein
MKLSPFVIPDLHQEPRFLTVFPLFKVTTNSVVTVGQTVSILTSRNLSYSSTYFDINTNNSEFRKIWPDPTLIHLMNAITTTAQHQHNTEVIKQIKGIIMEKTSLLRDIIIEKSIFIVTIEWHAQGLQQELRT